MRILAYHKHLSPRSEETVLERASQRQHILHKTILWDIGLMLLLAVWVPLGYLYAPLLRQYAVTAVLVPMNGSFWEIAKLLYFPVLLIGTVRYLCTGPLQKGILTTYAQEAAGGMLLLTVLLCTCAGVLGQRHFYTEAVLVFLCAVRMVTGIRKRANRQTKSSLPGGILLLLLTGCFVYFTYFPPEIGLFLD